MGDVDEAEWLVVFLVVGREGRDHPESIFRGVAEEDVFGGGGGGAASDVLNFFGFLFGGGCPLVVESGAEGGKEEAVEEEWGDDLEEGAAGLDGGEDFARFGEFAEAVELGEEEGVGEDEHEDGGHPCAVKLEEEACAVRILAEVAEIILEIEDEPDAEEGGEADDKNAEKLACEVARPSA